MAVVGLRCVILKNVGTTVKKVITPLLYHFGRFLCLPCCGSAITPILSQPWPTLPRFCLRKPFVDHRNLQQSSRYEKMCSTWDPLQCKAFFNKNDKKTGKDKVLCHIPQGLALQLQIRSSISQFASDRWRISKRNDPQRFSGRVTASRGWHGLIDARSFNTLLRDFSRKKFSLTQQVTKTIRQWSTRFKF